MLPDFTLPFQKKSDLSKVKLGVAANKFVLKECGDYVRLKIEWQLCCSYLKCELLMRNIIKY